MKVKQVFAVPPVFGEDITKGKEYPIFDEGPCLFWIRDDVGYQIGCAWNNCAHLNGFGWTRVEKEIEL